MIRPRVFRNPCVTESGNAYCSMRCEKAPVALSRGGSSLLSANARGIFGGVAPGRRDATHPAGISRAFRVSSRSEKNVTQSVTRCRKTRMNAGRKWPDVCRWHRNASHRYATFPSVLAGFCPSRSRPMDRSAPRYNALSVTHSVTRL